MTKKVTARGKLWSWMLLLLVEKHVATTTSKIEGFSREVVVLGAADTTTTRLRLSVEK
ncbi:TPA: hypothetical protein HA274_04950 [Candidatus Bathyarchaeota archaeon]|nr:hypothetical protein [Candidatus Bathyarchaeota archaeon]